MKLNPSVLFLYCLSLTIMAFLLKSLEALALLVLINLTAGLLIGFKKFKPLILAFVLSLIGVLTNAIIFAGGEPLYYLGPIVVRTGAISGFCEVSLKLALMLSATLLFTSLTNPRNLLKSLESELGVPKHLSFIVSLSLRLLKVFERDLSEIQLMRKSRGFRSIPITLSDWESVFSPLLNLGIERGKWIGIAAELRGFSLRKVQKTCLKLGLNDYFLLIILAIELIFSIILQLKT